MLTAEAPPTYNYLTILREPGRDAFVAELRGRPPFFEKSINAWLVAQPDLCRELLTSPALEPAPAVERYRDMPAGLAAQFASSSFAFDHLPLCLSGERHARSRQQSSLFLARGKARLNRWMEEELPRLLSPFSRPGRFDAMEAVVRPVVRAMIGTLADIDLPASLNLDDVSLVFDKSISMRRRQRLEADMSALLGHVRERLGPEVGEDEIGMRLALIVVGKDSILGSYAESLATVFADNAGRRLNEIDYPRLLPATAVPFVERIAVAPLETGGLSIAAGDRVRIVLQTYAFEPPQQHHRFFGAGAHACLGRPASVDLWGATCRYLSGLDGNVTLESYTLAPHSYVFNLPRIFEVSVTQ